jgi:hypothetical protein
MYSCNFCNSAVITYFLDALLAKAEKEAQFIVDAWTRFQVREFLKREPQPPEWRDFCGNFVQVPRAALKEFLSRVPEAAAEFVEFYRLHAAISGGNHSGEEPMRSVIRSVQQIIGNANDYVDISKDGSGIYATGRHQGYLIWKRTEQDETRAERVSYGAQVVRGFERLADVKDRLLRKPGVELCDSKLWRADMLLHLPKETVSGAQVIPAGYYYFGSINTQGERTYAELKPMGGGDNPRGVKVSTLLENGLKRV